MYKITICWLQLSCTGCIKANHSRPIAHGKSHTRQAPKTLDLIPSRDPGSEPQTSIVNCPSNGQEDFEMQSEDSISPTNWIHANKNYLHYRRNLQDSSHERASTVCCNDWGEKKDKVPDLFRGYGYCISNSLKKKFAYTTFFSCCPICVRKIS